MRLVYSFRIDGNDKVIYSTLKEMSKISKDLYNQALFEVKKNYEEIGELLQLDKIMKTKKNLEDNINYRLLPAKVAQQTLMLVEQNIQSFFKALADYKEHPEKYLVCPQFPNFLSKDGHFVLVFTNQQAKITEGGEIKLTKDVAIHIPEEEFEKYKQYFLKKEGFRMEIPPPPLSPPFLKGAGGISKEKGAIVRRKNSGKLPIGATKRLTITCTKQAAL